MPSLATVVPLKNHGSPCWISIAAKKKEAIDIAAEKEKQKKASAAASKRKYRANRKLQQQQLESAATANSSMNDDNPPTPMRIPHGMNYSYAYDETPTLDTQLVVPQRDLQPVPPPNLENLSSDDKPPSHNIAVYSAGSSFLFQFEAGRARNDSGGCGHGEGQRPRHFHCA